MKTILAQLNEISTHLDELDLIKFADTVDEVMQKVAETELDKNQQEINKQEQDLDYQQLTQERRINKDTPMGEQTIVDTKQRLKDLQKKQKQLKNPPPEEEPQGQQTQLVQPTLPTAPTGMGGSRLMV